MVDRDILANALQLYTAEQAAELLQVGPSWLRRKATARAIATDLGIIGPADPVIDCRAVPDGEADRTARVFARDGATCCQPRFAPCSSTGPVTP